MFLCVDVWFKCLIWQLHVSNVSRITEKAFTNINENICQFYAVYTYKQKANNTTIYTPSTQQEWGEEEAKKTNFQIKTVRQIKCQMKRSE